jgi:7-cyano-7-deazaguanine synthase
MLETGESMSDNDKSKKQPESSNVLVLLSGGIDSSACISYYISQQFSVSGLFVDYGQAAAAPESKAARAVSRYYDIPLDVIKVVGGKKWEMGCVPGRNAFLLFTALINFKWKNGLVAIGIHSGTNYWDCSDEFVKRMQEIFEAYTTQCICIDAPFLKWNKRNIWDYCIKEKVPVDLTFSCELGLKQPCGQCLSCKDLEKMYESC